MTAKLAFIAIQKTRRSARRLCAALGVSRSWVDAAPGRAERLAEAQATAAEDLAAIQDAFERSKKRCGAPRIHADLRRRGRDVAHWRVAKPMKENGVRPERRKRRRSVKLDSRHADRGERRHDRQSGGMSGGWKWSARDQQSRSALVANYGPVGY